MQDSFDHVQDWLNEVNRYAKQGSCKKLLIGNKSDCVGDRLVTKEEGKVMRSWRFFGSHPAPPPSHYS